MRHFEVIADGHKVLEYTEAEIISSLVRFTEEPEQPTYWIDTIIDTSSLGPIIIQDEFLDKEMFKAIQTENQFVHAKELSKVHGEARRMLEVNVYESLNTDQTRVDFEIFENRSFMNISNRLN